MSPYGWYQLARVHVDRHEPDEAVKIIRHLKGFEPKVAAQLERETGLLARGTLSVGGFRCVVSRPGSPAWDARHPPVSSPSGRDQLKR